MWTKKTIEPEGIYQWHIGKKNIVIKKDDTQWLYAIEDREVPAKMMTLPQVIDASGDRDWQSAIGEKSNALLVLPALPEMPLVIKPKSRFTILSGKSVWLYIPVPIYLQFYAGHKKRENLIFETPTENLSQTWFGDFHNGLLSYCLDLELSQTLSVPEGLSHHIICPVRLSNESHTVLDVQRLLLHGEYLTIYGKDENLVANEMRIKFKGESDVSDVQYAAHAPSSFTYKALVSSARDSRASGVLSKSFHFIKSLSNY